MNIIKRLKAENEILKTGIEEIRRYISSDKFNGPDMNDKMVNRNDILLRISEIENALFRVEE